MAIQYKGEILSQRELKKRLRLEEKVQNNVKKEINTLRFKEIRFLGDKSSGHELFEGKILEEYENTYKVKVIGRKNKQITTLEMKKKDVHIKKDANYFDLFSE